MYAEVFGICAEKRCRGLGFQNTVMAVSQHVSLNKARPEECELIPIGDVVVIEGHRHHVKAVGFSLAAFGPKAVSLVCQCERGRHALAHGSNSPELRRISVYIASPLRPQETP